MLLGAAALAAAGLAIVMRGSETEPTGGALRILRHGSEAEISGPLSLQIADALRKAASVHVVQLDSTGGSRAGAQAVAEAIRAAKSETVVTDRCLSVCVVAFRAGTRRWIGPFATIGLTADAAPLYRIAGLPDAFVREAVATASDQAWSPTREEMLNAGLATDFAAPDQFALGGFGPAPTADSIRARVLGVPLYRAVAVADPKGFEASLALWDTAVLDGEPATAAFQSMQALLSRSFQAALPHAADDLLLAHAALFAEEIAWMQRHEAALCPRWASTQGAMPGPTDDELVRRRHDLMQTIIAASSVPEMSDQGIDRPVIDCEELQRSWGRPAITATMIRELLRR